MLKDGKWARFGVNPDGPIDHSLPVLRVTDADGKLWAVLVNCACHCTTMNGNSIHGDWAGCAQQYIEQAHPGTIAMISIGCCGDTNPEPRSGLEDQIVATVKALLPDAGSDCQHPAEWPFRTGGSIG